MSHDPMDQYEADLASTPDTEEEAWVPKEGDAIVGRVEFFDRRSFAFGPAWVVGIRTKDGATRSVALFGQVLPGEFAKVTPRVGDTVGIKRLTNAESEVGRTYKRFRVKLFACGCGNPKHGVSPDYEQLSLGLAPKRPGEEGGDDLPF